MCAQNENNVTEFVVNKRTNKTQHGAKNGIPLRNCGMFVVKSPNWECMSDRKFSQSIIKMLIILCVQFTQFNAYLYSLLCTNYRF